jgi:hypothetical protein
MFAFLRRAGVAFVAGAASILIAVPSFAGPAQQATVKSLTGNWTCATHTSDGKTWKESDVNTMWGPWLKVSATYPAQNGQPASTGMTFFGYDDKHSRWVVTSIDTGGGYSSSYSTSSMWGGSKWHDGYPNNGGSATVSASKNQFVIDGSGTSDQGKAMTSHQICTRA